MIFWTIPYKHITLFIFASVIISLMLFATATQAQTQDEVQDELQREQPELQPTQIKADIPEEYNKLFKLQWGGGSLYQLKARLATMNCIANTIWMHNNNQWHPYNQYQVPSAFNTYFLTTYSQLIPPGTLHASCYDICEFEYFDVPRSRDCISLETMRNKNFYHSLPHRIDDRSPCTTNFDSRIQQSVLPSMPIYPDTCIIRQKAPNIRAVALSAVSRTSHVLRPDHPALVVIYENALPTEQDKIRLFNSEIHELCHTNQHWHFIENLQPDNPRRSELTATGIWLTTQPGQEFIEIVGFTRNFYRRWILPDNTYEGIYAVSPTELAAELCTMYFIDKMQEPSKYNDKMYVPGEGYQLRDAPIDFDPGPYLTPQIRQWIETYVTLPEITEQENQKINTTTSP